MKCAKPSLLSRFHKMQIQVNIIYSRNNLSSHTKRFPDQKAEDIFFTASVYKVPSSNTESDFPYAQKPSHQFSSKHTEMVTSDHSVIGRKKEVGAIQMCIKE